MENTVIIGILSAVLGGGTFGFVKFLIQRKDDKLEDKLNKRFDKVDNKMDEFNEELYKLDRKIDDNDAKQARVRVLRFSDEIQTGRLFSKDSFNQALDDITDYKAHCERYKDFPNDRAKSAMMNIKKVYDERLEQERQGQDIFL